MSPATTFRAAIGGAVVFLVIAVAAFVNHFISSTPHPFFGIKLAAVAFLVALACGVYANYNRPGSRV